MPELSPDEEASIRAWLAHIEETDSDIIAEVLEKCGNDLDARRYFLKQSEEVPAPVATNNPTTCDDCAHFERIDHPHLGHCAKGELEGIAGLWDSDRRYCEQFLSMPKQANNDYFSSIKART